MDHRKDSLISDINVGDDGLPGEDSRDEAWFRTVIGQILMAATKS
jgi:hypothetical protein